jgi:SAM-dependent methyltransferase
MQREDWDRRYAAVENLWATRPNRFLVREVEELPPGRALDLACGEGQNAIWLASLGWDVRGVDYSEVAIAKANARAERDGVAVEFVAADLVQYEPAPAAYDLVLVLYLHIPSTQRGAVHAKASAALAPGGTFLLLGHDLANLTDGVGGPSDPDLLYTADEIAAELPGLEIEKATTVLRDVDGEDRDAIDTIVRARRPVSL